MPGSLSNQVLSCCFCVQIAAFASSPQLIWPSGTHRALPELQMPPGHLPPARPQHVCALHSCQPAFPLGGRCACRGFGCAHPGAGALLGKVTGERVSLYPGQPAGEDVFGIPAVPGGQMRGRSYIWKVPFGSLPGCCSKLSPELALTLRVQLPSTSIPLPGPTPHSAPFFPPCFSFLRAVKRCSLPVTVPPPSLPPSCWSKPPSWNSPAD